MVAGLLTRRWLASPALLPRSEGRVVQRSVDRVGRFARDMNANAWALMHGGIYSPRHHLLILHFALGIATDTGPSAGLRAGRA
jgi:hypothetical protein